MSAASSWACGETYIMRTVEGNCSSVLAGEQDRGKKLSKRKTLSLKTIMSETKKGSSRHLSMATTSLLVREPSKRR